MGAYPSRAGGTPRQCLSDCKSAPHASAHPAAQAEQTPGQGLARIFHQASPEFGGRHRNRCLLSLVQMVDDHLHHESPLARAAGEGRGRGVSGVTHFHDAHKYFTSILSRKEIPRATTPEPSRRAPISSGARTPAKNIRRMLRISLRAARSDHAGYPGSSAAPCRLELTGSCAARAALGSLRPARRAGGCTSSHMFRKTTAIGRSRRR